MVESELNNEALTHTFFLILLEEITGRLATVDLPLTFSGMVELGIKVENRESQEDETCYQYRLPCSSSSPVQQLLFTTQPSGVQEELMQQGCASIVSARDCVCTVGV